MNPLAIAALLLWAGTGAEAGLGPDILGRGGKPPAAWEIRAYSEFLPAPLLGPRPYEATLGDGPTLAPGELLSLYEERTVLQPGLTESASRWLATFPADKGPVVSFTPVTLSRVKDMGGGYFPWALFGGAEEKPEIVFWESLARVKADAWLCSILQRVYAVGPCANGRDLRRLGVAILSDGPHPLPELKWNGETPRYLVTFLPESEWPRPLAAAYGRRGFVVLPTPETLAGWRSPLHRKLAATNPDGWQLPLAEAFHRQEDPHFLKLPKVFDLPLEASDRRGRRPIPRFSRLAGNTWTISGGEAVSRFRLIFDPSPEVTKLYGKPIARNVQVWGTAGPCAGRWYLDGPRADKRAIARARESLRRSPASCAFRYREYYPPLRINGFELRWRRPVVAWRDPATGRQGADFALMGTFVLSKDGVTRRLPAEAADPAGFDGELAGLGDDGLALNVKKILEFHRLLGGPLTEDTADSLVTPPEGAKAFDFRAWWGDGAGKWLAGRVRLGVSSPPVRPLTLGATVGDAFEAAWWDRLVDMTERTYRDKNNVDCTTPELNERCLKNHLPEMAARYLRPHYEKLGLEVHYHLFHWVTDFDWFPDLFTFQPHRRWWGGLELNLPGRSLAAIARDGHKNVIAVIPGENRDEAVILADHYDTAYMDDVYTNTGMRHAAKGADDNHSGTATLMEAAKYLRTLKLKRDVWLVHLTGEEFPADCLGARALTEHLVTGKPVIAGRKNPKIVGLYVLDMIGHSTDRDHDPKAPSVFQIAPGPGARAARLAETAHRVARTWNASTADWNRRFQRTREWERIRLPASGKPEDIPRPRPAVFPRFRAEIRPGWHPASAYYNTDAIIFGEAGIPAVLFMENYDIGREGYHDTKDTLENIDLDYGAGMARIAIETVAQVATE